MRGTNRGDGRRSRATRVRAALITPAAVLALVVAQSSLAANAVTGPLGRETQTPTSTASSGTTSTASSSGGSTTSPAGVGGLPSTPPGDPGPGSGPTLRIVKSVDPSDCPDSPSDRNKVAFTFTSSAFSSPNGIQLRPCGEENNGANVTGTDTSEPIQVTQGETYSVTESEATGWSLQSAACSGGEYTQDGNSVSVTVGSEDVTCTFSNAPSEGSGGDGGGGGTDCTPATDLPSRVRAATLDTELPACGSLTITKVADGASVQDTFSFDSPELSPDHFQLKPGTGDDSRTFHNVVPGTYTITENQAEGWDLSSVVCDGNAVDASGGSADLTVGAGEDVSCTFTNVRSSDQTPGLSITKTANVEGPVAPNDAFDYAIVVANSEGSATSGPLEVTDQVPDGIAVDGIAGGSADCSSSSASEGWVDCVIDPGLDGGSSVTITVHAHATGSVCASTENTAYLTTGPAGDRPLQTQDGSDAIDDSTASVTVDCGGPPRPPLPAPTFSVVKTGPGQAHEGDTITYSFQVSVTNDQSVSGVTLSDPICDAGTLHATSTGDGDSVLEPGETWTYACTHVVTASDPDPLVNVATVSGHNGQGTGGSGQGTASTDILHPSLKLELTSDPTSGSPGDDVQWTYQVTNTGDVTLNDLAVRDDLFGQVGTQAALGAFRLPGSKALAPGDSVTFTEDGTVPDQARPLHDAATATAVDPLGRKVSASDGWTLDIVLGRTVTPTKTPAGGLAFTGSTAVIPLGILALLFLMLGSALLWISRGRGSRATGEQA